MATQVLDISDTTTLHLHLTSPTVTTKPLDFAFDSNRPSQLPLTDARESTDSDYSKLPSSELSARRAKRRRVNRGVIRTGCTACLYVKHYKKEGQAANVIARQAQVKCDSTNPECRQAVSDLWRSNTDVCWRWHGTWRERRGIQVFIGFATAPEQAGLFESKFWHRTVLQACFYDPAVYAVGVAIGALHEHIVKRANDQDDSGGLAFALRQCNKSIGVLTSSTNNTTQRDEKSGVALVTCVLFACFESMQGDRQQAIMHALQGRKLLKATESLAYPDKQLVDPRSVRPVMGRLETQAKSFQGRAMERSDHLGEPPLPVISHLSSLEHAHDTLHFAYTSLLCFCQDVHLDAPPYDMAVMMADKYLTYAPWLKSWERAFVDFLFREAKNLSPNDMQRAKVLKANLIISTILATLDQGLGKRAWEQYESDFKAIIDLSASVLNTYTIGFTPTLSNVTFRFPYLPFGLWVAEPLFITMSRCTNPELRRQAAGLLSGMRSSDCKTGRCRRPIVDGMSSKPSNSCEPKYQDDRTMEEWIEFGLSTRLDAGMAIYFGGLPMEDEEKPVMTA